MSICDGNALSYCRIVESKDELTERFKGVSLLCCHWLPESALFLSCGRRRLGASPSACSPSDGNSY